MEGKFFIFQNIYRFSVFRAVVVRNKLKHMQ